MTKGSNSDFTVASFMAYFWEQFSNKAHEEYAVLMWQGDGAGSTSTYLDLCDGWLKRICGLAPIRATQTTVTSSNVIAEMGEMLTLLPDEVHASAGLQFFGMRASCSNSNSALVNSDDYKYKQSCYRWIILLSYLVIMIAHEFIAIQFVAVA